MYKLMAEQSDLGNQLLPSITDECTPMNKIKEVLAICTDMYNFLCHAKKWNMVKKGGGGTFNYSGGDGSSSRKVSIVERKVAKSRNVTSH